MFRWVSTINSIGHSRKKERTYDCSYFQEKDTDSRRENIRNSSIVKYSNGWKIEVEQDCLGAPGVQERLNKSIGQYIHRQGMEINSIAVTLLFIFVPHIYEVLHISGYLSTRGKFWIIESV